MEPLNNAADHLAAAMAALRMAASETESALASMITLRVLEQTAAALNECNALRDALKADHATSQTSPAR